MDGDSQGSRTDPSAEGPDSALRCRGAAPRGRLRKAWIVHVRGFDEPAYVFGATRNSARREVWRSLEGSFGVRYLDISAVRAPWRDVELPARDPVADRLSDQERAALMHSFGADTVNPYAAGGRDFFYTRRDDPVLVSLDRLGLMSPMDGDVWGEGMTYFVLTAAGRQVALSMVPEYRT